MTSPDVTRTDVTGADRPRLLHCVSAYPDPIAPETQASSLLLALTAARFDHKVFSFKRAGWKGPITALAFDDAAGEDHRAMVYGAPPKGMRLARTMAALADWIIADSEVRGLRPDLVHAHKVSMDGLVGARVAAHFEVPLVLSVQANTDARIIATRRDLKAEYDRIWRDAAVIFPFAPAAENALAALLGPRQGPSQILPCPTRADDILPPCPRAEGAPPVVLSAFHLAHYRNKNIKTLLQALALAAKEIPDIRLDLIGGGDAQGFLEVAQMAEALAPGRVSLLGARGGDEMQARMNKASVFAMPSYRESYGMVFAEALLAGTPCLHSSDRAIDGLFPDGEMTLGVPPEDAGAMAAALVRFCREETAFKARIATAQTTGGLEILRRDTIAARYSQSLHTALGHGGPDAL